MFMYAMTNQGETRSRSATASKITILSKVKMASPRFFSSFFAIFWASDFLRVFRRVGENESYTRFSRLYPSLRKQVDWSQALCPACYRFEL